MLHSFTVNLLTNPVPEDFYRLSSIITLLDLAVADVRVRAQTDAADTLGAEGAVAVDLAARVDANGLIVESTFTSIRTLARLFLPLVAFSPFALRCAALLWRENFHR